MSWLIHSSPLSRAMVAQFHAMQRLAAPPSLRRARAGMMRVITLVAGH